MQELVLIQPMRAAEEHWSREAAQSAKRREFEERLAECGPLAYRVARGVLRNDADAEDVAQEALLRAYRRFDRLRDAQRFRGWLVRIVFRLALDRARSAKRRELRETEWAAPSRRAAPPTAEDLAASSEFQAHFDRAMDELSEKLRLVLLLSAMGGPYVGRSCGHAGVAGWHGEVAAVCRQKEISGEVAMLCDKYKEALIDAAVRNAAPSNALRQHIEVCAECRAVFAKEQVLCASIDSQLRDCANAKPSSSYLPRLRARIAEEPTVARRWSPVWTAVGASAILTIAMLLPWKALRTTTTPETASAILASNILPSAHEKQPRSESLVFSTHPGTRKSRRIQVSRHDIRDDELDLLFPINQRVIVDHLIGHIQRGEIDGKALVPSSQADLQISTIEIPPITTSPMLETSGDSSANSGVLGGKTSGH